MVFDNPASKENLWFIGKIFTPENFVQFKMSFCVLFLDIHLPGSDDTTSMRKAGNLV